MDKQETKSRSAELWYTEEDRIRRAEGNDPHKWHDYYYEHSAVHEIWDRWSNKVRDQICDYERDCQMGASKELKEERILMILDLLDDLKIGSAKTYDGQTYLAMKRRFL